MVTLKGKNVRPHRLVTRALSHFVPLHETCCVWPPVLTFGLPDVQKAGATLRASQGLTVEKLLANPFGNFQPHFSLEINVFPLPSPVRASEQHQCLKE